MALCTKFENILVEGMVVFLSKFGVGENRGKYPLLKHRYKLNFYRCTSVKRCNSFDGPLYGFNFFDFSEINQHLDDPNLPVGKFFFNIITLMFPVQLYFNYVTLCDVVDIIGCVIESGNLEVYDKENGNEGKRMVLVLEDLKYVTFSLFL